MARKSYVQVKIEGKWTLIPKEDYRPPEKRTHMVIPDLQPYKSMATGEMITSRRQHRDHLRRHNLVEVGNEKPNFSPSKPRKRDDSLRRTLHHLYNNVSQEGPR